MSIWLIDEAEDFEDPIILNCCTYFYYTEETFSPWDDDMDVGDW